MFNTKNLLILVLVSGLTLASSVQAQTIPKLGSTASPAVMSASNGAVAKASQKKQHVSKPSTKHKQKARPVAKKNHQASDRQTGNSKGPGLEAF